MDIAQIANMAHLIVRSGMHVAMWVIVWSGSRAAIGEITVHVYVEAMELAWVEP